MSAPADASPPLPLRNSYWVVPGLLLAGEHPNGPTRDKTKDRLKKLLAAGIECFVDLTKPTELLRYDTHLPFHVEYARKAIQDHGTPARRAQMAETLEYISKSMAAGRPVYVHCRAGIGRTGTVVGCLLVERGLQGDAALDELNRLWQQCKRSRSWVYVPETDAQAAYVREWKPAAEVVTHLTTTGSFRAGVSRVADVQARAASQATGAGQARAAVENLAAGKGRGEAKHSGAGLSRLAAGVSNPVAPGTAAAGVSAAAEQARRAAVEARAAVERGEISPSIRAEISDALGGRSQPEAAPSPSAAPAAIVRAPVEPTVEPDPLFDPDTLAVARGLRERFVGTLFGLAVGDAVAAPTQYRRPGTFSPIGDMIGGGPFDLPRGAWSDDTAMALCLAESLLERDGFDARDQVQRYSRWQQEGYLSSTGQCVGITASTARSLALAKWRRVVFPGSHDPAQQDPESLSRIAPIALFYFASLETTLVQAADASRTTCQAPAVLDACRRLGRALNAALSGQPKTKILAEMGTISEAAAQSNETATTALAAALWAFSSTANFRDAVLRAANVGGNSDVVASVCGQLAGAHYGVTSIPQAWRSGLMEKDLIEGYADRLLAHSLVSLSG